MFYYIKKATPIISFLAIVALMVSGDVYAASSQIRKVKGGYCIYTNKWSAAIKSGKSYSAMNSSNKAYKKLSSACKTLLSPRKVAFNKIPNIAGIVTRSATQSFTIQNVSGTPPTLSELASGDARNYFYVSGVLDGILSGAPTPAQCEQFYSSNVDGASGGMSACQMAQTVGESMGNVLQSGTTSCYMRKIPEAAASDKSVATVTAGSLPAGGWRSLFTIPDTKTRLVKFVVSGDPQTSGNGGGRASQNIFIRVSPDAEALSRGVQYAASIFFCDGAATPSEIENVTISSDNTLVSTSTGAKEQGGTFSSSVTGRLIPEGSGLSFDPTASRTARTNYIGSDGNGFKAEITINDGKIFTKIIDRRESVRRAYSIASYSGSTVAALRFLSGGFKEKFTQSGRDNSYSGGVEYRDTGYRAAPSSELAANAVALNFDTDSFYSTNAVVSAPLSFSCENQKPDITIALDMTSSGMRAISKECETARFDSRTFCQSNELNSVRDAFFSYCAQYFQ